MNPTTVPSPTEQLVTTMSERSATLTRTLGDGMQQHEPTLAEGDGAQWIWHIAERHFPRATQIVDWLSLIHISEPTRPY